MRATASLVDVFGVPPARGRWFSDAEDQPGGGKVVVLTHAFWTKTFSRDPAVLGKTVTFDGEPYEVIGVLPEDFSHRRAEIFVPLARKLDPATRGNHFLQVYARLKPGVTLDRAATIAIDGRVLLFNAAITAAVGLFWGAWPLVRMRTKALAAAVREGDTRTGSATGRQFGNGLVIAEIALAFALLVGGALLVKNLVLLEWRDAGITTERVITFDLSPAGPRYKEPAASGWRSGLGARGSSWKDQASQVRPAARQETQQAARASPPASVRFGAPATVPGHAAFAQFVWFRVFQLRGPSPKCERDSEMAAVPVAHALRRRSKESTAHRRIWAESSYRSDCGNF